MLELTTTRRRAPLAETTFVTKVPPYIQTYIGDGQQQALHRRHLRLRRGLSETTFVTRVPPYIQTYLGGLGARMYDDDGNALAARMYDERGQARELLGFGALDATVGTRELQTMLRKIGFCQTGPADNLWGPNTAGALAAFAAREAASRPGAAAYVAGVDWMAENRATTVRLDSGLLGKLRFQSAGQTDECASGGGGGGGGGPMVPLPDYDADGADTGSIFRNPWLWAGIAAVVGVGYYAYTKMDDDRMMMSPPRL